MEPWQEQLKNMFTLPNGDAAIEAFDDTKKIVALSPEAHAEIARNIEAVLQSSGINYEVKQL